MNESFFETIENQLVAKAEAYREDIRHVRKFYAKNMRHQLADLRATESELRQVRKARKLLEAAEDNES